MTELDDRLREHFTGIALSPEALAEVHAGAEGALARGRGARRADAGIEYGRRADDGRETRARWMPARPLPRTSAPRLTAPRAALASVLVAALAVGMHLSGSLDERTERTLAEVAMNHATRLTFEFEEDTLAGLDGHMQLLPFEMAAPARLPDDVEVLGSRYCSLAGRLAAHVKLRDAATGRPLSLFVTSVGAELERLDGNRGRVDGVEVELFREGGLFYAMARQAG